MNYQIILESKRQEIRSRRRDLTIERTADLDDRAVMTYRNDMTAASIEADRLELRRIEAALERLRDGSFGICAACDKPIPAKRLDARPEAERCVPCQSRMERRELQEAL